jgi:hypothetical protein
MTFMRAVWLGYLQGPTSSVGLQDEWRITVQIGAEQGFIAPSPAGVADHHDADEL